MTAYTGHCKRTGKRVYRTESDAEHVLRKVRSRRLRSRNRRGAPHRVEYDFFECEHCQGFHLTSESGRNIYEGMS